MEFMWILLAIFILLEMTWLNIDDVSVVEIWTVYPGSACWDCAVNVWQSHAMEETDPDKSSILKLFQSFQNYFQIYKYTPLLFLILSIWEVNFKKCMQFHWSSFWFAIDAQSDVKNNQALFDPDPLHDTDPDDNPSWTLILTLT